MNKTVTINISGIIFHIEEDAYEKLSKYLSTIKGYFSTTDGGNEIMSDIEARIAEMLQSKVNATKQVVLMQDVDTVIEAMGKPEEFAGEGNSSASAQEEQTYENTYQEPIRKRLFRNPDEKALGGVCSGIAEYFNVDVVWVRIITFLLIFFGGMSILVYIILWIVIPEARTTADKLAMRGEPVNINNIKRTIQDEAEDLKNRMGKYGNDLRNSSASYGSRVNDNIASFFNGIFRILGRLFGLFMVFVGTMLLIGFLSTLLGFSLVGSNHTVTQFTDLIFANSWIYGLSFFTFILVAGIPVFFLLYVGIKLLFNIHYSNRWLNLSLGGLWTIGIILSFFIFSKTASQFTESSKVKETFNLSNVGDTLNVRLTNTKSVLQMYSFDDVLDLETKSEDHRDGKGFGFLIAEKGNAKSLIGFSDVKIIPAPTDSIEVVVYKKAKGEDKRTAMDLARNIQYSYTQTGNTLLIDEIFVAKPNDKFRDQEVEVIIKLPKGKVIYLDRSLKHALDDVDNVTNTWDGDMVGRRWKMTDSGLACIDCKGIEEDDEDKDEKEIKEELKEALKEMKDVKNINIDEKGIKIDGGDTKIQINEKGVNIQSPKGNVELKDKDNK
ncbi:MAG: PspC domain-containing protein [Sediminibacterium sp.]|nr:PspC domain-containing protein [Sediminibacterium sp.]